ncbi:unnamed protein product [Lota lota]
MQEERETEPHPHRTPAAVSLHVTNRTSLGRAPHFLGLAVVTNGGEERAGGAQHAGERETEPQPHRTPAAVSLHVTNRTSLGRAPHFWGLAVVTNGGEERGGGLEADSSSRSIHYSFQSRQQPYGSGPTAGAWPAWFSLSSLPSSDDMPHRLPAADQTQTPEPSSPVSSIIQDGGLDAESNPVQKYWSR